MIKVIMNGVEKEYDEKEYDVFSKLWEEVAPKNMVITRLVINGSEIPISKMDEIMNARFDGGEKIEMTFKNIGEAAIDLIDEALAYIANIDENLDKLIEVMNGKNIKDGLESFQKLVEGVTALENMRNSMVKLTRQNVDDLGLRKEYENVKRVFENINSALDAKKYKDLVQTLKQNFRDVLEFYRSFLEKSKSKLLDEFGSS